MRKGLQSESRRARAIFDAFKAGWGTIFAPSIREFFKYRRGRPAASRGSVAARRGKSRAQKRFFFRALPNPP